MIGQSMGRVVPVGVRPLLAAALILSLLGVVPALPVRAATVSVGTTADDPLAPAPLGSYASDGTTAPCTLREAIVYANAHSGTIITLPAAAQPYKLTRTGSNENSAQTGDLDIHAGVTINGAGAATTIIDGNGVSASPDRVFDIYPGMFSTSITVAINGVTIQHGVAPTPLAAAASGAAVVQT